jgi:hypothetical protein
MSAKHSNMGKVNNVNNVSPTQVDAEVKANHTAIQELGATVGPVSKPGENDKTCCRCGPGILTCLALQGSDEL